LFDNSKNRFSGTKRMERNQRWKRWVFRRTGSDTVQMWRDVTW